MDILSGVTPLIVDVRQTRSSPLDGDPLGAPLDLTDKRAAAFRIVCECLLRQFALDAKVAKHFSDRRVVNGERLLTGVSDVNEEAGTTILYAPQTFQDATTRTVPLDLIASVAVTDIEYGPPSA